MVVAAIAPDVVWHFKPYDQDTHVELPGSLSQGVRAQELVQPPDFRIIVGGIVMILPFTLAHDRSLMISLED